MEDQIDQTDSNQNIEQNIVEDDMIINDLNNENLSNQDNNEQWVSDSDDQSENQQQSQYSIQRILQFFKTYGLNKKIKPKYIYQFLILIIHIIQSWTFIQFWNKSLHTINERIQWLATSKESNLLIYNSLLLIIIYHWNCIQILRKKCIKYFNLNEDQIKKASEYFINKNPIINLLYINYFNDYIFDNKIDILLFMLYFCYFSILTCLIYVLRLQVKIYQQNISQPKNIKIIIKLKKIFEIIMIINVIILIFSLYLFINVNLKKLFFLVFQGFKIILENSKQIIIIQSIIRQEKLNYRAHLDQAIEHEMHLDILNKVRLFYGVNKYSISFFKFQQLPFQLNIIHFFYILDSRNSQSQFCQCSKNSSIIEGEQNLIFDEKLHKIVIEFILALLLIKIQIQILKHVQYVMKIQLNSIDYHVTIVFIRIFIKFRKCLFDWFISNASRSCPICRREFQENNEEPTNNYNIIRNTFQQWIQQFIN